MCSSAHDDGRKPISGSYFAPLLQFKRATGESRFPLYDGIGTVRGLADAAGNVTDLYTLDAFGAPHGSTGSTPDPYRFGGAWGYITDTPGSGMLQLGQRYYWPEIGRFVHQDPLGDGMNWYAYVGNNPVVGIDPEGLFGGGLSVSEVTDVGLGKIGGAGQNGAASVGLLRGRGGTVLAASASWGGFANAFGRSVGYPSKNALAVGAFGGGGLNVWFTNAESANQLKGPATITNINAGWFGRVLSLQTARSGDTWAVSVGVPPLPGAGWGAAASSYATNTVAGQAPLAKLLNLGRSAVQRLGCALLWW